MTVECGNCGRGLKPGPPGYCCSADFIDAQDYARRLHSMTAAHAEELRKKRNVSRLLGKALEREGMLKLRIRRAKRYLQGKSGRGLDEVDALLDLRKEIR